MTRNLRPAGRNAAPSIDHAAQALPGMVDALCAALAEAAVNGLLAAFGGPVLEPGPERGKGPGRGTQTQTGMEKRTGTALAPERKHAMSAAPDPAGDDAAADKPDVAADKPEAAAAETAAGSTAKEPTAASAAVFNDSTMAMLKRMRAVLDREAARLGEDGLEGKAAVDQVALIARTLEKIDQMERLIAEDQARATGQALTSEERDQLRQTVRQLILAAAQRLAAERTSRQSGAGQAGAGAAGPVPE
jgi:hypothetical protein